MYIVLYWNQWCHIIDILHTINVYLYISLTTLLKRMYRYLHIIYICVYIYTHYARFPSPSLHLGVRLSPDWCPGTANLSTRGSLAMQWFSQHKSVDKQCPTNWSVFTQGLVQIMGSVSYSCWLLRCNDQCTPVHVSQHSGVQFCQSPGLTYKKKNCFYCDNKEINF